MDCPVPNNEAARVLAVESYGVTDTPPEISYDDIAELAAQLCGCPIGLVNIIADTKEWLKAKYGLPPNLSYLPRGTCCSTAICQTHLLEVPDLQVDQRFCDQPAVKEEPHFRFYCGMPLINPEGYALGTVCVFDFEPRQLSLEQSESLRRLAREAMTHLELRRKLLELGGARKALEEEKQRSAELIRNILPDRIAEELKVNGEVAPRYHDAVTIMFTDFKDFTRIAESTEPRSLVNDLHQYFSAFDEIIGKHGLEKLKTIGDSYMCAGGLPEPNRTHPSDTCMAALEIRDFMAKVNSQRERMRLPPWEVRIGVHTGAVMAGVVGRRKFTYDIWGDAVNIASRLESTGEPGQVVISDTTYNLIRNDFACAHRGTVETKNRGAFGTHILERANPSGGI